MVKNLHVQLDDELFRLFKIKCARDGVKGSVVIRELIERWLTEDEGLRRLRKVDVKWDSRLKRHQALQTP